MLGLRSSGSRPAPWVSAGPCPNGESQKTSSDREEGAEAEQHARRIRDDVAQAIAREVDRDARPDRQQPDPQQQRPLLRGPHRREPVEQRRRRARSVGDGDVGEVVADEGHLEDHHRERQHDRQAVDRAPSRVDPVAPSVAGPVERRRDPVEADRQRQHAARRARRTPSARRPAHDVVLGAATNFDGHLVIIEPGCATNTPRRRTPVTISSLPCWKAGGTLPL